MTYTYGMKLRGFSIGCQPKEGFIKRLDDNSGKYHDLIVYNRKLTEEEVNQYELDYIEDVDSLIILDYDSKEYNDLKEAVKRFDGETLVEEGFTVNIQVLPNDRGIRIEIIDEGTKEPKWLEFLTNNTNDKFSIFFDGMTLKYTKSLKKKLDAFIAALNNRKPSDPKKATITPMIKVLEKLFDNLNEKLFGGELIKPVITIAPDTCRAYGWFTTYKAWKETDNKDGEGYYEITVTSNYLNREPEEIAGTLLHEMCHLYAQINGIKDCSNNGVYHNKKFKEIAEEHGLVAERMGNYGFTNTYPTDETAEYFKSLNLDFPLYRPTPVKAATKKSSSIKYICPICGAIVRATRKLNIICEDCGVEFIEA